MGFWKEKDFTVRALFLAQSCKASYGSLGSIEDFYRVHGYDSRVTAVSSLEVVVAHNEGDIQVCFRGTEDWHDVMVDLTATLTHSPYGRVHKGFYEAWKILKGVVYQELQKIPDGKEKPLFISGHSMGAALAALCALQAKRDGWRVDSCWTYGMPRVGDIGWKRTFVDSGIKLIRVVDAQDIVTKIPFLSYRHVGDAVYLDPSGSYRSTRPWTWNPLTNFFGSREDHNLRRYIDRIASNL